MTNPYYNHDNPFMPGTVVRAEEANDQLDAIEVGFDRIDVLGTQIEANVTATLQPMFQQQMDDHTAEMKARFDMLKDMTEAEIKAIEAFTRQSITTLQDDAARTIKLPPGVNNMQVPGRFSGRDVVPYIDRQGNAQVRELHGLALSADWAKVYLGRQTQPPGTDNFGNPVREGAMYYDESLQKLMVYRSGHWHPAFMTKSDLVVVSNVEPMNKEPGMLWFDSETADLLLWYDDGTSVEWVVINSNYNALFGPGVGPILKDGSVAMEAPLKLLQGPQAPEDAVNLKELLDRLRALGGPGTIYEPHVTNGVDPRSPLPRDASTGSVDPAYNYRIGGTILFFGSYGQLHSDYGPQWAGQAIKPGDYAIATGNEWQVVKIGGGKFHAAKDLSGPNPFTPNQLTAEDYVVHSGVQTRIDVSWPGVGGLEVSPGDMIIWDGVSEWNLIPSVSNLDRFLRRDGVDPMTGNMDMGTFRINNLADGAVDSDAVNYGQLKNAVTNAQIPWGQLTGVPATFPPSTHNHDARYFQKTEFVDATAGAADKGKPVKLGTNGKIPESMLDLPDFVDFKGAVNPIALPVSPQKGDFYIANKAGTVNNTTVRVGDFLIYDGTKWDVISTETDLSLYLMLSGGTMTGPIAMSGEKITSLGDATAKADAVNLKTLHAQAFQKTQHVNTSAGATDSGKPVVLDSTGRFPINMLRLPSVLKYKGTLDPNAPLPANPKTGDVYIASAAGTIDGHPAHNLDWVIYDGANWEVVSATDDLSVYLMRDGSAAMTGNLNFGNHRGLNLATPTRDTDAATKKYVDDQTGGGLPADAVGQLTNDGAGTFSWVNHRTNAQNDARYARASHGHAFTELTGVAAATQIPNLNANKITAGTIAFARLPHGTGANQLAVGNHSHAWGAITGKPTTFPPRIGTTATTAAAGNHSHAWGDITGKPSSFTPATHSHSWASITGKPASFPPATHSHSWGSITGKPNVALRNGNYAANKLAVGASATALKTVGGLQTNNAGNRLGVGVAPAQALHVAGQIVATNDITAFYSDERLKTDLQPIYDALDKVDRLRAFTYRPNDKARELGAADDDRQRVGVSAQDVASVQPEAVAPAPFDIDENNQSKSGEHYLTVQYEKLVPLLISAVQELTARVEELENG